MADRINVPSRSLFIGDNLDILRGINSDCVDLIYLNPPRNTGTIQKGARGTESSEVSYSDIWTHDEWRREWFDDLNARCPDVIWPIDAAAVVRGSSMSTYLTFMGVRLVELARVMKPTGCIYLQCDPRVSPYLRVIMDAIFGYDNFKNEVVFRRRSEREGGRRWMWAHDSLLFYTGPQMHRWNRMLTDHDGKYYNRNFGYQDEGGRFRTSPLTKAGVRSDDRGTPWSEFDPSRSGRNWSVPVSILAKVYPDMGGLARLSAQEKLDLLDRAGLIHRGRGGAEPRYKIYTSMAGGQDISDLVTHIDRIEPIDVERTGWPGQVPVELVSLILEVSTTENDLVLDPFCGSGTACVAAEALGRRWIGIEQEPSVDSILTSRLLNDIYLDEIDMDGGADVFEAIRRGAVQLPQVEHSPPTRTDREQDPVPEEIREIIDAVSSRSRGMLSLQGGRCAEYGCVQTLCPECHAANEAIEAESSRSRSQEGIRP